MGSFAASANTSFLLGSNTPVPSGTANGVLYLNGSKVPTSGSALTFNGTQLYLNANNPNLYIEDADATVRRASLQFGTAGGSWTLEAADDLVIKNTTPGGAITSGSYIQLGRISNPLIFGVAASEAMRLNSTGLGIGTNNPGAKLDVNGGDAFFGNTANTAQNIVLRRNGATVGSIGTYNSQLEFSGGATLGQSHMVVTSAGNVGIGASSPSFKLQVEAVADGNAGIYARNQSTGTSAAGNVTVASMVGGLNMRAHSAANSTWPSATLIQSDSGFTGGLNILQLGANPILFWTNGAERLRIDSAGNLGLGVVPAAWASTWRTMQISTRASISQGAANDTVVGYNFFQNSSAVNIYLASAGANSYVMDGAHKWFIAPSGTAGNTVTFTQAMTLDVNGRLMVGTTTAIGSITAGGPFAIAGSPGGLGGGNRYIGAGGTSTSWFINVPNGGNFDFARNEITQVQFNSNGDYVFGTGAIATNATNGFIYTPSCAGAPTGVPAAYTGRVPMVVDTTNLRVYFNIGGTWRYATLT